MFVLVAGPPGSGKSTLAKALSAELHIPVIAKDEIKEAMMNVLGQPATVPESQRLGRAAVMAMLVVAEALPAAVLDSTFYPYTEPFLRRLRPPLIEVRCRCPREVVEARYRSRSRSRHRGHLDAQRSSEELWNDSHLTPLGLGPLIEVDTSSDVDVRAVAARVRDAASPSRVVPAPERPRP